MVRIKASVEIVVDCSGRRTVSAEEVEESVVGGEVMRIEEGWSDGGEAVSTILVVDEAVIVEGVDDVGDRQHFERLF